MSEINSETLEQTLIKWEIDESARVQRGRIWYILMIVVGAALLIYAVASANFLFALLVLMFALVIYLTSLRRQEVVVVEISADGIKVAKNFYPYRELKRFWFVYEPPNVKNLYLDFRSVTRPLMTLPLADQNPNQIRQLMAQYLPEDFSEDEEPFLDFLGRVFKL
jgi:hypothetical protein